MDKSWQVPSHGRQNDPKRGVVRVQGQIFEFKNPLSKFQMCEGSSFKFGIWIDLGKSHLIRDKIPPKGAWPGSRAQILNFKPFSIYLEWVKLETSNLVHE